MKHYIMAHLELTAFAIRVISTGALEGKDETPMAARLPIQSAPSFFVKKSDEKSAILE